MHLRRNPCLLLLLRLSNADTLHTDPHRLGHGGLVAPLGEPQGQGGQSGQGQQQLDGFFSRHVVLLLRGQPEGLPGGDGLDLHQGVLGQPGHLYGAAGRGIAGEEGGVDLVHGGEVVHVLEEHGGLDHVLQGQPGGGQDSLDVQQGLAGLAGDAALGEGAGGRVHGELAGGDDDAAGGHALGVWTDRKN